MTTKYDEPADENKSSNFKKVDFENLEDRLKQIIKELNLKRRRKGIIYFDDIAQQWSGQPEVVVAEVKLKQDHKKYYYLNNKPFLKSETRIMSFFIDYDYLPAQTLLELMQLIVDLNNHLLKCLDLYDLKEVREYYRLRRR
jgi:hypothetical protein